MCGGDGRRVPWITPVRLTVFEEESWGDGRRVPWITPGRRVPRITPSFVKNNLNVTVLLKVGAPGAAIYSNLVNLLAPR